MMIRMIPALGWLGLFTVYLRSAAGTFTFEDSPELLGCAVTLGNSHEPGYPLLCLLNRLAFLLPVGTNAFRQNLLGAATAAGAAVLAGALSTSMLRRAATMPGLAVIGGAFTAALWGLSDAFWWQAGIGDKYPLLYLLFVAVLWSAWLGRIRTTALAFGLAIAHHPFGLFTLPAFGWAARKHLRHAPLLLLLICLPLSLRFVYPPVRAVSDMNWGDPVTAPRLGRYLTSGRYHAAVREARETPGGGMAAGAGLGWALLRGEMTIPGAMIALTGVVWLRGAAPGFTAALGAGAVLNLLLAIQTPEKVVRWYGPLYAIVAILAGIGWGSLPGRIGGSARWRTALAAAGVVAVSGWQAGRGQPRNDHSFFYAAHDGARNLLVSLPPASVYLGRGDDDLFPLWAARWGEGMRTDTEAVGMGTLVDVRPADAGGLRRLNARVGLPVGDWDRLRWLLTSPRGIPVRYARTGYDDVLWAALGLQAQRSSGLAAERTPVFDGPGSVRATRRVLRGWRWRGLRHGPAAAVHDRARPRDEVARDALLQPVHVFATLGVQLELAGHPAAAVEMYGRATKLLEPFTGTLPASREPAGGRAALAIGFDRLAGTWDRRGVPPVAARLRRVAEGFRVPVGR